MITSELLAKIFPGTTKAKRDRFLPALNKFLPRYGITTQKRVAAFLATGGVETDYLRTTVEYASGTAYEGRGDLGNSQKGDGVKFKGRGFFQTTGRFNYGRVKERLGKKLGIDFLKNPERLAEIELAVESACIFWQENNLAKYADAGQFKSLSAVVNCGDPTRKPNHWSKRNELWSKCLRVIPKDFSFDLQSNKEVEPIQQLVDNSLAQTDLQSNNNPVVLTPAEQTKTETEDSFLTAALDKNVSPDEVKAAARTHAPALLWRLSRPFALLYAALEAGNIYAWLGVVVALAAAVYLAYAHRADLKKLFEKMKGKLTS